MNAVTTARPVIGVAGDLLSGIGRTPLIELRDLPELPPSTRLFAKLESRNPGGSIKDRPVSRMLLRAVQEGRFDNGRRLLDSSSGNAGIAYAMLGASLGIPVTLVVPGNASRERLDRIRAHGAEFVLTDPVDGYDCALREVQRIAAESPERYWHCDQYTNEDNWKAHYSGTGSELLEQVRARTGAAPRGFVAGVGTGGTITGVGRRLREEAPGTFIGCLVPEAFPGIEGLKPLGSPGDIVPAILDESLIDDRLNMAHEEALETCRQLAMRGLFVGPSSGANVLAACRFAAKHELETVATTLNDTGERYGSTLLWSPESRPDESLLGGNSTPAAG